MPTFFLLEVGTEELPASFVDDAIEQCRSKNTPLTTEAIDFTAHRRLAVLVGSTNPATKPEEVKGPRHRRLSKMANRRRAAEGLQKTGSRHPGNSRC